MNIHSSLTPEVVLKAAEESMYGMENLGFCIACGAEHYECEPDARNYECDECGERQVYAAAELIMTGMVK